MPIAPQVRATGTAVAELIRTDISSQSVPDRQSITSGVCKGVRNLELLEERWIDQEDRPDKRVGAVARPRVYLYLVDDTHGARFWG